MCCVHTYVEVHMQHVCVHVCVHECGSHRPCWVTSSIALHLICWDRVCHWAWSSRIWLDWLSIEPLPFYPGSQLYLTTGVTGLCHYLWLYVVPGVLILAQHFINWATSPVLFGLLMSISIVSWIVAPKTDCPHPSPQKLWIFCTTSTNDQVWDFFEGSLSRWALNVTTWILTKAKLRHLERKEHCDHRHKG